MATIPAHLARALAAAVALTPLMCAGACARSHPNDQPSTERPHLPSGISLVIEATDEGNDGSSLRLVLSNQTRMSVRFDKRGFDPPYVLMDARGTLLPQIPSAMPKPLDRASDILTLEPGERWVTRVQVGRHLLDEKLQDSTVLVQIGYFPPNDYPDDLRAELFAAQLWSNIIELGP